MRSGAVADGNARLVLLVTLKMAGSLACPRLPFAPAPGIVRRFFRVFAKLKLIRLFEKGGWAGTFLIVTPN